MNLLKAIFTWWTGSHDRSHAPDQKRRRVGGRGRSRDRYYETVDKKWNYDGRNRRFVIYNGYADASRVGSDWHGWLHHTFAEPPTRAPLARRAWERNHQPNLTGTLRAWRPRGSIARGGERAPASGDYQPWTPD